MPSTMPHFSNILALLHLVGFAGRRPLGTTTTCSCLRASSNSSSRNWCQTHPRWRALSPVISTFLLCLAVKTDSPPPVRPVLLYAIEPFTWAFHCFGGAPHVLCVPAARTNHSSIIGLQNCLRACLSVLYIRENCPLIKRGRPLIEELADTFRR